MTERKTLKDYMTPTQKAKLGNRATLHKHCMEHTGVARPGKTARERAKRNRPLAAQARNRPPHPQRVRWPPNNRSAPEIDPYV